MNIEENKYSRLESIYTKDQLMALWNSRVVVLGLGGVGSYCACALARGGIGHLVLVDFDKIEESNINRQLFATEKTIGFSKTELAKNFILDINNEIELTLYPQKINSDNVEKILSGSTYVVDAIDDVNAKIQAILFCQKNSIPIISCMGTAMRTQSELLKFADIFSTSNCPLCKTFRKAAKDAGIESLEVLYSTEQSLKTLNGQLGSTSYIPPIAGLMLAGKVINSIVKL